MFMGQTAHTQAKESVMAMQVSVCEGAEEKKSWTSWWEAERHSELSGDASDGCHIMAVKLPKELRASQAVCETSELVNGADKGLQAVFDCCQKFTKTDKTCPERSMMTWSTFFLFAVMRKDLWLCWSWVMLMTLKVLHWFQKTQVWFSVCFWSPLLTLDRRKELFEWC